MRTYQLLLVLIVNFLVLLGCTNPKLEKIDLSGIWVVKLDSTNVGADENWARHKFDGTQINLPGTLDDARIGNPSTLQPALNNYVLSNLVRKYQYIGKAWYQKEIDIPDSWEKRDIVLSLERIIWESTIYVDGHPIGSANSLVGSHEFDLTKHLKPGKHLLTFVIDNSNKFPNINIANPRYPEEVNKEMAHAYTNHTQIKWNGILGNMVLIASVKNSPSNLQIFPNKGLDKIKITFEQFSDTEKTVKLLIKSTDGKKVFNQKLEVAKLSTNTFGFEIDKPESLKLWDEFAPNLYDVELTTNTGKVSTRFGYKFAGNNNGDLTLNNKRIYLRGNLECAIFPLTGYPPTKKEEWAKLILQAKSYGLNHLRFHSWCPPKAAFEAADEAGFYYQVELPHWSLKVGQDEATTAFLKSEADKIIKDYGNHPSFVFMALGNELQGDAALLNNMVAYLKAKDNRHMYITTSFSFQKPIGYRPEPEDDILITQWTDKGWIRGQGIFNDKSPHFDADYTENAAHIKVPLVSHEIGQYSVYPDMSEIEKYTGVLKPVNFEAIKLDLEKKGLLDLAPDFTYASGKLAALLYKEEIERALKTPSFDGFQLLQLQDFPGQGTALVGLLNAFWESKGVISAEEFRAFNSEVVPLIRFEKAVYQSGETFKASIEVANFYKDVSNQNLKWSVTDATGTTISSGTLSNLQLTIGNNTNLGTIDFPVAVNEAKKITISVELEGTEYKNSWPIWCYPKQVETTSSEVLITNSMDEAETWLNQGKKVLLNPEPDTLEGIAGRFVPVFWSPVHFPNQPATMGLLLNKEHSVFNYFPTDNYTNWQWWDLCIRSKSVITDSLNVTPLVRVIDNFVTNHHLSNLFEAKTGKGSLVFSSIDLIRDLEDRPVARQLRHSILKYMESEDFAPTNEIDFNDLHSLKLNKAQEKFSAKNIYELEYHDKD